MRRGVGLAAMSLTGLALFAGASVPPIQVLPPMPRALPVPPPLPEAPPRAASVTHLVPAVVAPASPRGSGGSWVSRSADLSRFVPGPIADDVMVAYSLAVAASPAGCHIPVTLLMAIGQVESGNLAGHTLDASHRAAPPILGPVLDGTRWRAIPDTDAGQLDGNTRWDRAVGPMQFIPESWRLAGVDMDGDGRRDPQDIYDAAGAAMVYLCAGGRDLATAGGVRSAVLGFNHSEAYLHEVLRWKATFDAATDSTGASYAAVALGPARDATAARDPMRGHATSVRGKHGVGAPGSATAPSTGQGPMPPSSSGPAPRPVPTPPAQNPGPPPQNPGPPTSTAPEPTPAEPTASTPAPDPAPTPTPTELPPCPPDTPMPTPPVVDPSAPVPTDPAATDPVPTDPATCLPVPTQIADPGQTAGSTPVG